MSAPYQITPYAQRGINPHRLGAVRAHAGKSILDVGCGNGVYVTQLKNDYAIKGVDWVKSEAWEESPQLFTVADGGTLPYADNAFETILCFEALEHLPNPLAALQEFYRVCTKNVIITVPNCSISPAMRKSNLLYSHWGDRTHCNFFTLETIEKLVAEAGFRVVVTKGINAADLGPFFSEAIRLPQFVSRVLSRFLRRDYFITCLVVAEKPGRG